MSINPKQKNAKERLFAALVALMRRKNASDITVSELTAAAGLSRMAFYRNYGNLADILEEHLSNDLFGGNIALELVREIGIGNQLALYFRCLKSNQSFLNGIIEANLSYMVMAQIHHMVDKFWSLVYKRAAMDALLLSVTKGIIYSITIDWIKSDMKQSPEELANILLSLVGVIDKEYETIIARQNRS
ncbi:MAG: TetR/AcrR family transcriptional regulator [Bacilli bacterium]|jgi:AcrR family transcriptional regulator